MAGVKWTSDASFTEGEELQIGDKVVGLRSGANYKFEVPSDGLKDGNGNYLLQWATTGASATNYLKFTNGEAGSEPIIAALGSSANVGMDITTKGTGKIAINSSTAKFDTFRDEDDMASDDENALASQQSIKKYVDDQISGTPTSIVGTEFQVLANGNFGTGETGTVTLTTPQDIATTSQPTFARIDIDNVRIDGNTISSTNTNGDINLTPNGTGDVVLDGLKYPQADGSANQHLKTNGSAQIGFTTSTYADTYAASELLFSNTANTVEGLTTANSAMLSTNGSGVPSWQAATDGQLLIGNTGNQPSVSTLTAGTGIGITNGAGTITINGTGSGFSWNEVTGTSQTMAVNNGYIANNAAKVDLTLPASANIGDHISVVGKGSGGWKISQNAGQTIHNNSTDTTTGTGGSIESSAQYNTIELVCITANTDWVVTDHEGALTVT